MARPLWEMTKSRIRKVEEYAAAGLTKEQIADCLGIHYDTLNEKCKAYPEFSSALKRGKSKGLKLYADLLMKNAKKGNAASTIFYLKAQGKWNDQSIDEMKDAIKNELNEVRKIVQECKNQK